MLMPDASAMLPADVAHVRVTTAPANSFLLMLHYVTPATAAALIIRRA